jgi:hypothetical protein
MRTLGIHLSGPKFPAFAQSHHPSILGPQPPVLPHHTGPKCRPCPYLYHQTDIKRVAHGFRFRQPKHPPPVNIPLPPSQHLNHLSHFITQVPSTVPAHIYITRSIPSTLRSFHFRQPKHLLPVNLLPSQHLNYLFHLTTQVTSLVPTHIYITRSMPSMLCMIFIFADQNTCTQLISYSRHLSTSTTCSTSSHGSQVKSPPIFILLDQYQARCAWFLLSPAKIPTPAPLAFPTFHIFN